MKVALHTDQLWFSAPGGIGTYVRELLDGLRALEDAPEVVTFQVGATATGRPTDAWSPGRSGRCYPRWALTGRPALPAALALRRRARDEPRRGPARRANGRALVATVHDLAFDVFPEAFPPRGGGCTGRRARRRPGAPT